VAGKYRALLIGNSTYPVDEHNLQPLRGPVKDIAALNRALIDGDTGLFDDVDVTLLPEASSTRALRAISRFFSAADRDDVLLMYFSGHGKLDQSGRLHLCMQDTETTDLLSTAVSSTRINEFAEASLARNVVIVLDCCYAGAFRGGDFGNTVAGPGRYVLTSCRGTQLANDATVENGTSYFTQHLVDGLLGAAEDSDHDGFVAFSDLYGYIDRRLRGDGKQIPQRRVFGDGDLRLARRTTSPTERPAPRAPSDEPPSPVGASAGMPTEPGATVATPVAATDPPAATRRFGSRRQRAVAADAAAVLLVGVAVVVTLLTRGRPGSSNRSLPVQGSYTAAQPWRLRIDATRYGNGCTVAVTDHGSGSTTTLAESLYSVARFQIPRAGEFTWHTNNAQCLITPLAGTGDATLPFTQQDNGDTDVFTAPSSPITVQILDARGSRCTLRLYDANGQELDLVDWSGGTGTVTMNPNGRTKVFVYDDNCIIRVAAQT
jgi:hypothetical protein